MRRLLQLVALLSALVWAGLVLWTRSHRETELLMQARTAAFCVMFFAGALMPASPRQEGEPPEEETF